MKPIPAFVSISIIILVTAAATLPAFSEEIPDIADIRLLRKMGMHEQARNFLLTLKNDSSTSESLLRQAYAELATIAWLTGGEAQAMEAAREALERFYDIEIDIQEHPGEVAAIFETLRRSMFSPVSIASDPPGANVRIDGKRMGNSPLSGLLLPPGVHELKITMVDFNDESRTIIVEKGKSNEYSVSLEPIGSAASKYGLGFGIEAGIAVESLSYANQGGNFMGFGEIDSREVSPRITGGVFVQMMRNDRGGVLIGARYADYGERVKIDGFRAYEIQHHSLVFSSLFKYYLSEKPKLFLIAGPEASMILSSRLSPDGGGKTLDIDEFVKNNQLLLDIGAGIEFQLGGNGAGLSVQYAIGMLDMKDMDSYELVNYKPRELRVTGFYLFY